MVLLDTWLMVELRVEAQVMRESRESGRLCGFVDGMFSEEMFVEMLLVCRWCYICLSGYAFGGCWSSDKRLSGLD